MQRARFVIDYSERAKENIKSFPKNIQKRITDAIKERLTTAPNEYGEPLIKEWKSHRRIRVGDYRVIYKVYEEKVVVFIVDIDNRRDIYNK